MPSILSLNPAALDLLSDDDQPSSSSSSRQNKSSSSSTTTLNINHPFIFHKQMDHSTIADRVAIMRIQERTTYKVKDYIKESAEHRKLATKPVDADCRIKMCEWCFQVVDFCKFRRETVTIGMSYLDRFLCTPVGRSALCNRKEYQLAAMTALYIAIKLHEPLEMETSLLAELSRGCYTEMEFVDMECVMLQAIKWRVNGPTCLAFLSHFIALLPSAIHATVGDAILEYARYQTEIAVAEQVFIFCPPSELALAATLNAVDGLISTSLFPTKSKQKFLRYIERYCEMNVSNVEKLQNKLSYIMVNLIQKEWETIDERIIHDWTESNPPPPSSETMNAALGGSSSGNMNSNNNNNNNGLGESQHRGRNKKSGKKKDSTNSSNTTTTNNTTTTGKEKEGKQRSPVSITDELEANNNDNNNQPTSQTD